MKTPKDFDGKFVIQKSNTFGFLPEDEENNEFPVWFYRREQETHTLKEFLDSITSENIGWDVPTRQLFYRAKSGKMYRMGFTEIK